MEAATSPSSSPYRGSQAQAYSAVRMQVATSIPTSLRKTPVDHSHSHSCDLTFEFTLRKNLAWLLTMHRLWAFFTLLVATASAASKHHGYGHSHGHGHGPELQHSSVYEASNHVGSADESTARCLGLTENESCNEADGSRLDQAFHGENSPQINVLDNDPTAGQRNAYGGANNMQRPEQSTASSNQITDNDRPSTLSRNTLPTADRLVTTKLTPSQFPSDSTLDAYSVTNFFPYSPSRFDRPTAQSLPESRDLEYRADDPPSPYATLQRRAEESTPHHNMLARRVNITFPSSASATAKQSYNATLPTLAPTRQSKNITSQTLQQPQNTDNAGPSPGAPFQQHPSAASGNQVVVWGMAGAALIAAGFCL
ncbi:hypothetical protein CERZMDRAFT_98836 [Cercospora zeae-maydis SCOH1-5]|uniref:Uncharacterized protein n=1 Tax=Cercospora zeae-maydis SCOH1-5 TaxID=717836 RepID=A0A6A6FCK5_9PEZI|nr:hypothetical protein CERZMDRAFT_98836 [Cercospora zeae-maydis SCOH1-5]